MASSAQRYSSVPAREAGTIHGVILLLAAVMPAMAIISLVPVLPMLGREFADVPGAVFLVPMALTIPALCVALFSPVAGWLSDKVGRKWLLVFSLVAYALIGVIPYFLTDLIQIIVARVALGVSEAIIMTVATAMLGDYYQGERRERWVSAQIAAVSFSAIVLIAVGGALGEAFGSRGPFMLYVIALPIAALVALKLFEPVSSSEGDSAGQDFPYVRVLPLLAMTLIVGILFYTIIVKLGAILGMTGEVSAGTIGMIGAATNTGVVLGAIAFSRLTRASGPMLLTLGLALLCAGYVGMALSGSLIVTAIFSVVTAIGCGLLLPTLLNWILQILKEPVRGRGSGLFTGMFFLGQFVAPIIVSAVQGQVGGELGTVLLIWSGISLAGAVMALILARGASPLRDLRPSNPAASAR